MASRNNVIFQGVQAFSAVERHPVDAVTSGNKWQIVNTCIIARRQRSYLKFNVTTDVNEPVYGVVYAIPVSSVVRYCKARRPFNSNSRSPRAKLDVKIESQTTLNLYF